MLQRYTLGGEKLGQAVLIPELIREALGKNEVSLPKGIVDYSLDSGLVKIIDDRFLPQFMKMGKLLRKAGNSDAKVRDTSATFNALLNVVRGCKVEFSDPEGEKNAMWVYDYGPHSCMSGCEAVAVYDCEDAAVAYVQVEHHVVARCVVNLVKKEYLDIYGNSSLLEPLLHAAGYEPGDLQDCRLQLIEDSSGRTLAPYRDDGLGYIVESDCLTVCSGGEGGRNTDGYIGEMCSGCNEIVHEDEVHYSEYHDREYCCDCFFDRHVEVGCSFYALEDDDVKELHDGDHAHVDDCYFSEHTDKWYLEDEVVYSEYCDDYLVREDAVESDGEWFLKEDSTYCEEDDEWVCGDEVPVTAIHEGRYVLAREERCTKHRGLWFHDDIIDEVIYSEEEFEDEDKFIQNFSSFRFVGYPSNCLLWHFAKSGSGCWGWINSRDYATTRQASWC